MEDDMSSKVLKSQAVFSRDTLLTLSPPSFLCDIADNCDSTFSHCCAICNVLASVKPCPSSSNFRLTYTDVHLFSTTFDAQMPN